MTTIQMTQNKVMDHDLSEELFEQLAPRVGQCYRFTLGSLFWLARRERAGALCYAEGWVISTFGSRVVSHSWLTDDQRIVDPYAVVFRYQPADYFPAALYTLDEAQHHVNAMLNMGHISLPIIADDNPVYLAVKQMAEQQRLRFREVVLA